MLVSYEPFFTQAQQMIFIKIIDLKYAHNISRKTGMTYSTVHKHIMDFKSKGLVDISKDGRSRFISLTKKGEQLFLSYIKAFSILNSIQKV
jgi:DNA-binding MarR family transcriptional regulator